MVCDACQSKLTQLIVPDKWKEGAKNVIGGGGSIKAGKTNKFLEKKKAGAEWLPQENICRICKSKVMLKHHYCNDCAHKKGICSMCGKKAVDVSAHKMSLT